jgi:hypothetical protein
MRKEAGEDFARSKLQWSRLPEERWQELHFKCNPFAKPEPNEKTMSE